MEIIGAEIATAVEATLGEGALWDNRTGELIWIDIIKKRIYKNKPGISEASFIQLNQYIGTVAVRENGGLLAALQDGVYFVDDNGDTQLIIFLEAEKNMNRANDGKCDQAGRLVVGTMGMNEEGNAGLPYCGALYSIDKNRVVGVIETGLSVPNGIAWRNDGRAMYHIDSHARSIFMYQYDLEIGVTGYKTLVMEIPIEYGTPDGMTIDGDGNLWVAMWDGWQVLRIDPVKSKVLSSINLPASQITSCTFGGSGLDELYITSARTTLQEDHLINQPHSGCVFVSRPGVAGMATNRYAG